MKAKRRSVAGRVVAITGGTRGIGRATAAALRRERARVAIAGTDGDVAQRVAAEVDAEARGYELDVRSRRSFAAFLDAVEGDLGPLDVLVNNAGIMHVGPFLEESDGLADGQIDINLKGVIIGTKEALPRMLAREGGHVVNLASVIGTGGFPYVVTYCSTKHAIIGLTNALRMEFADTGVEFSCVLPTMVNTDLSAGVEPGRGVGKAETEDVADAIVGVLREPRYRVHVPPIVGRIGKVMAMLPQGAADAIGRALEADKVLVRADQARRLEYERRIAAESERGRIS